MYREYIIGAICVYMILTGSLPGISRVLPYSNPLSIEGIYGRAAGLFVFIGYLSLKSTGFYFFPLFLMGAGLILFILGLLKGVDRIRNIR
ncbi:hypothetical protein K8I28_05160 [bacterium]|nr:hypothetical protein [bacterium]